MLRMQFCHAMAMKSISFGIESAYLDLRLQYLN